MIEDYVFGAIGLILSSPFVLGAIWFSIIIVKEIIAQLRK